MQICEAQWIVRSGEIARWLTLERRQELVVIGYRWIGVGECKKLMHIEIAKGDLLI